MTSCVGACQPPLSKAQLQKAWTDAGGNPAVAPLMAAIALAESGGIPNNTNPVDNNGTQTSWGLWQVSNGTHSAYPNWSDPVSNARIAVGKYNTQGLTAWGTFTSGAYKRYLDPGALPVIPALPGVAAGGQAAPSSDLAAGTVNVDREGLLFSFGGTSVAGQTILPGLSLQRSTVRRILGGAVMVAGAAVGLAGVFVLVGGSLSRPKPLAALSGLQERRREGRLEEARVTMAAQGRRRETAAARSAENRREAEAAVKERQAQNKEARRQEDALQRIEARRLAQASNVRRSTPGHGRERTSTGRRTPAGSGTGDF